MPVCNVLQSLMFRRKMSILKYTQVVNNVAAHSYLPERRHGVKYGK